LRINIYEDKMRFARLFGADVLYTPYYIPRKDVPQGWYCYDLRGTVQDPDELHVLTDMVEVEDRVASVLSILPLKNDRAKRRRIDGKLHLIDEELTLAEFCEKSRIRCPEKPGSFNWHLDRCFEANERIIALMEEYARPMPEGMWELEPRQEGMSMGDMGP